MSKIKHHKIIQYLTVISISNQIRIHIIHPLDRCVVMIVSITYRHQSIYLPINQYQDDAWSYVSRYVLHLCGRDRSRWSYCHTLLSSLLENAATVYRDQLDC